jgi:hypothetical protein
MCSETIMIRVKTLYENIQTLKRGIKTYKKRKIMDEDFLRVLELLLSQLESDYITNEKKEK